MDFFLLKINISGTLHYFFGGTLQVIDTVLRKVVKDFSAQLVSEGIQVTAMADIKCYLVVFESYLQI